MKCPKCNTINLNSNRYCKKCGNFLENLKEDDYVKDTILIENSKTKSEEKLENKIGIKNSENSKKNFSILPHPLLTGLSNKKIRHQKNWIEYFKFKMKIK